MIPVRAAPASVRSLCGMVLALLLALRLLTPAGFMPAFDHGSVAIVACPDSGSAAAPAAHHDRNSKQLHQLCPYAAASAAADLAGGPAIVAGVLLPAAVPLPARPALIAAQRRVHPRPPSQAPPIPD